MNKILVEAHGVEYIVFVFITFV